MKERMVADLHTHDFYSGDSTANPYLVALGCAASGITCLAVTNHNTTRGADETRQAAEEMGIDLTVISGQEITTGVFNEKEKHVELLGFFLKKTIPSGEDFWSTMEAIKRQDGIIGIPHPFDLKRHGAGEAGCLRILRFAKELEMPVIIEVSNSHANPVQNRKALEFYEKVRKYNPNVYAICGSDTHYPGEIGRARLTMLPFTTKEEFLNSLSQVGDESFECDDDPRRTLWLRALNRLARIERRVHHSKFRIAPMV